MDRHRALLCGSLVAMEACWLYALMALLNEKTGGGVSVLWVLFLLPISFLLFNLLSLTRWHRFLVYAAGWTVWAIAMLLLVKMQLFSDVGISDTVWLRALPQAVANVFHDFRPELLILLSSAVLWAMGQRLAFARVFFTTSLAEFQFGLVALLLAVFISSQVDARIAGALPVGILFFLFALTAIFLAHAQERTGWLKDLYRGHWFVLLIVSVGLVITIGVLAGLVVNPGFVHALFEALKWAWGIVLVPLRFIWGVVLAILDFFDRLTPNSTPNLPPTPAPMPTPKEEPFATGSGPARTVLSVILYLILSAILLLILWRITSAIVRWLRRRMASTSGARTEPLRGAFKADLLNFLRAIISRLARLVSLFRLPHRRVPLPQEVASVRQMYRQFLRWAADSGFPRKGSQTPQEYSLALSHTIPDAENDLRHITRTYVSTRYGPSLPTTDEVREFKESWRRVKQQPLKNLKPHAQP